MKTVSGRVQASKPVSVSKAARILSKFVSSDNAASPAFVAYLKRASASFNELVQLRRELKGSGSGSGSDYKGKKKHVPDGVVTEETVNSVVKKHGQYGLLTEEKLGASDGKKQNSEGHGSRNSARDEKKLKKKRREGSEIELITYKDQTCSDVDAVDVNVVNDERPDGDKETKEKKKRDKGDREQSDDSMKIEKQEQSFPLSQDHVNGEATDVLENGVSERKKHKNNKKGKEKKESSDVTGADRTDPSDGGNENNKVKTQDCEGKKQKKKRNCEGEERESEGEVEVVDANTKESKKRKHKGNDHGGLDGSEEQHRSKKKSRRNEVDD